MASSRAMPADDFTQARDAQGQPARSKWHRVRLITGAIAGLVVLAALAVIDPWLLAGGLAAALVATIVHVRSVASGIAAQLSSVTDRQWATTHDKLPTSALLPDVTAALLELQRSAEQRDLALRDAIQRERLNSLELEVQALELNDAHDRLAEANAELEAFTYSASHDLAVPLRTIESFAQLLRETSFDVLDDAAADFVDRIQSTATRTRALIADLLVLSRIRDDAEVVAELHESREEKFVVEHGPLPSLIAPPERIRPILQNLIQNGLKYNLSDIPRVAVHGAADGGIVFLDVLDNGIGIGNEEQENVFGLFQRGRAASAFSGTGAGLAIARRAARSLNGELWLQSSSPEGSHFALAVPCASGERTQTDRPWLTNYIARSDPSDAMADASSAAG